MAPKRDFVDLYTKELDGQDDTILALPKGVKVKILFEDPEVGRQDIMVKFPPGYREPLHTHESSHSTVVLEGKMCVAGKELGPGDYVFGWRPGALSLSQQTWFIIILISGEATEVIEGKETSIKAGDVLFIPAGEKHTTINRSTQDFRYLEFFTSPPLTADFVEVK